MPVNGATNGLGSVQQSTNAPNVQEQQPTKSKWGRKLRAFSPKNLFIGKSQKNNASHLDTSKKLRDFKIKSNAPTVYVQQLHILVKMNALSGKREHLRFPKHCPPLFLV